jgi:hypothetical protein
VNTDITHINEIIKNAMPFPLRSCDWFLSISNTENSVFVALQANTTDRARVRINPPIRAHDCIWLIKEAIKRLRAPELPPEISAVFAFLPMKITAIIPHKIRNRP